MPITNLNPTVNTTPNIGGTSAIGGISNTGHSAASSAASAVDSGIGPGQNNTTIRTARWSSFNSPPAGTINALTLKFTWQYNANVAAGIETDGSAEASVDLTIEYSLDGGGSWLPGIARSLGVVADGSDSDSEGPSLFTVGLMVSQNISNVQVRESLTAHAEATSSAGLASANAGITSTVTDIRIEADTTDPAPATQNDQVNGMM